MIAPVLDRGFTMRHRLTYLLILLLVASGWLLATPLPSPGVENRSPKTLTSETPIYGGTYRRPLDHEPATLDPAKLNDIYGRGITQQIFDGLVEYDEAMAIRPAIAESWSSSRDGLTWTFTLRKGVRFHHGREVTAEDFVYSFTRVLEPQNEIKEPLFFYKIRGAREYAEGKAKKVAGLRALDRYTLEISLTSASVPFIMGLAMGHTKVVPREIVESKGENFGRQLVGTGPFKLVKWTKEEIILEANKEYFGGAPYLDKVIYFITKDNASEKTFTDFEKGLFEDSPIPLRLLGDWFLSKRYTLVRQPRLSTRFIAINNQVFPFTDKRVRQALNYAVDRKQWLKRLHMTAYPRQSCPLPL